MPNTSRQTPTATSTHRRGVANTWLIPTLVAVLLLAIVAKLTLSKSEPVHLDETVWQTNPATIFSQASSEKPVLALFTADWCGPCQALKANVLQDPQISQQIAQSTLPLYVDLTAPEPQSAQDALSARYGITTIPQLLLLDSSGNEISRLSGVASKADFTAWLKRNGLNDALPTPAVKQTPEQAPEQTPSQIPTPTDTPSVTDSPAA